MVFWPTTQDGVIASPDVTRGLYVNWARFATMTSGGRIGLTGPSTWIAGSVGTGATPVSGGTAWEEPLSDPGEFDGRVCGSPVVEALGEFPIVACRKNSGPVRAPVAVSGSSAPDGKDRPKGSGWD